jgi:hypothetical protein
VFGIDNRPCGACGELVSATLGCVHWKPGVKAGKKVGWTKGRSRGSLPADSPEVAARTIAVLEARGLTTR